MCEYRVRYLHLPVLFIIFCYLSGCAIAFKPSPPLKHNNSCNIESKKYELYSEVIDLPAGNISVAAVASIAVPVVSFLVSGSIVLIGNTINWLEYQGKCDGSVLNEQLEIFIGSVNSASSVVFDSVADLDKYLSTEQSTND